MTADQSLELAACMPLLAGRSLVPPCFHTTTWKVGEIFCERDDPDRTHEPWEPPAFLQERLPERQVAATTAEEIPMPRKMPGRFARVVRGAMNEEDCAELLARVNQKGFTPALLNVGGGLQQLMPMVRDGHRVIVDSPELAAWLLEVLRPHLPEVLEDGSRLVELNERLRFLCYTPGQSFDEHTDGMYRRPAGHLRAGDMSRITVQLYLNDVPAACGGATTFYPGHSYAVGHQPEVGSVLLFTQDLTHEGSLLREGLKYTLRTEVMYTKRQNAFQQPISKQPKAGLPISELNSVARPVWLDLGQIRQNGEDKARQTATEEAEKVGC